MVDDQHCDDPFIHSADEFPDWRQWWTAHHDDPAFRQELELLMSRRAAMVRDLAVTAQATGVLMERNHLDVPGARGALRALATFHGRTVWEMSRLVVRDAAHQDD
ncbi:ANTAR domain-containing protein [Kribbella deserti]|uniref:ANTAR domain-containing protein n=1 Tax=Kribbella deserti TaxID=1926257 RepID=A0ABV6QJ61_9ACTN